MRYVSTRGQAPELGFADTLLAGLARDGGLYVPSEWPLLPTPVELDAAGSYAETAASGDRAVHRRRDRLGRAGPDVPRRLRHVPASRRRAARAARRSSMGGRALPRPDAGVQGRGAPTRGPIVRPRVGPAGRTGHDRRRHQWRHGLGRDRGRPRLCPRRHRHPVSRRRTQRGAASADDHGRRRPTCARWQSMARSTTARIS